MSKDDFLAASHDVATVENPSKKSKDKSKSKEKKSKKDKLELVDGVEVDGNGNGPPCSLACETSASY